MKRHTFLPILISFLSALGIFAQYKFSQHEQLLKHYETEEHSPQKPKPSKEIGSSEYIKKS